MKNTLLFVVVVCAFALAAQAQEAMMSPPNVLVIEREVIKPGRGAAHQVTESGFVHAFAKAKWPTHYIGTTAMTGETRAVFFVPYESMAAWEADNQAQDKNPTLSADMSTANTKDGENLSDWREAVFTFKPDLSYQPSMPLAGVRYFRVFTVHVKPGHGDHFESVRKIVKAAHEKAKLDEHFAVFSLVAGGAPNTYVIFIPMKSLKEIDDYAALHGQTYKDALGADGQKQIDDFQREAVESSETNILAFSPEISYPSEKWIAADKFWAPAAPAKPAAKKKE